LASPKFFFVNCFCSLTVCWLLVAFAHHFVVLYNYSCSLRLLQLSAHQRSSCKGPKFHCCHHLLLHILQSALIRYSMAANAAASLLEIERDRLLGSISHLERSVDELKAAIAEEGPDQDYRDAINENVVVIAKYKARVAALEEEIQRVKSGSTSLLAAVPVVDEDNMQQAISHLRQQMGLAPPSALTPAAQQQQQQQQQGSAADAAAAADQQRVADMELDHPSAAAAAPSAGCGAASSIHTEQQQQQPEGRDGVWL
jgi:hypothetical protein